MTSSLRDRLMKATKYIESSTDSSKFVPILPEPLLEALVDCAEIAAKAAEDKWEVESQSTGMKYGGPTQLAEDANKAIDKLNKLLPEETE